MVHRLLEHQFSFSSQSTKLYDLWRGTCFASVEGLFDVLDPEVWVLGGWLASISWRLLSNLTAICFNSVRLAGGESQ